MFHLTAKQKQAIKLCAGPQRHTRLVGGARSAKTFTFVRNVGLRALRAQSRHVIFRHRANACHASVYLDTWAKVRRLCFPNVTVKTHGGEYDTLPNGSEIWFAGLDDKDRVEKILGMEFATVYLNECSQIPYTSALMALTRLAQRVEGLQNRAYYDLNPTTIMHWTERLFVQHVDPISRQPLANPQQYKSMLMNPVDNVENIDPEFLASLLAMPERYRKRFYDGLPVSSLDNALWTPEMLETCREAKAPDGLERIVVAIDPSGSKGLEDKRSDEIGITVTAKKAGHGYLLEDASGNYSPEGWGREAIRLYRKYSADAVVGEVNYGGDMVRATIHAVDRNVKFKAVTASRGKVVRAEPIGALYEKGGVSHVGDTARYAKLEDQLLSFTTDGYKGDRSPDRADSLIWGFTELLLAPSTTGGLEFYAMEHERRLREEKEARSNAHVSTSW